MGSHAIFTVMLEQQIRTVNSDMPLLGDEGKNDVQSDDVEIRQSKFHFVDLAGSERAKRTVNNNTYKYIIICTKLLIQQILSIFNNE